MMRVQLTAEDLSRVRIGPTYGPLVETSLALSVLQPGDRRMVFDGWRQRVTGKIGGAPSRLAELFPRVTYLDMIGLTGRASSMEEGLDAFRSAAVRAIDEEIDFSVSAIHRGFSAPSFRPRRWVNGLLERRGPVREQVARELGSFHDAAIAPHWPRTRARLDAEHSRLVWTLAADGVDAVLQSLHPSIRWQPPFLEIDMLGRSERTWSLGGQGLLIVPSLFCSPGYPPSTDVANPSEPQVLFYPAVTRANDAISMWHPGAADHKALAALLGQTRAVVLQSVAATPCTTGELASRAGTSPASASQHATVLRNAGLITTRRQGSAVCHQLTALGADLLG